MTIMNILMVMNPEYLVRVYRNFPVDDINCELIVKLKWEGIMVRTVFWEIFELVKLSHLNFLLVQFLANW